MAGKRRAVMSLLDNACRIEAEHGTQAAFPRGFAAFVREHDLPRATAYRHRARVLAEGRYEPRSRRPRSSPGRTPDVVVARVIALRAELAPDCGADMIRAALQSEADQAGWAALGLRVPARSTINAILDRAGLLVPTPKRRPRSSLRRFAYAAPRDCYQIDGTTITGLGYGTGRACVIEVLDDATRTLVATHVCDTETTNDAVAALTAAIQTFGAPGIVLADNGKAFAATGRRRVQGHAPSRFARFLTDHRIRLINSTPYHPQTCGKVERHHQSFKKWLAAQITAGRAPTSHTDLQALADEYQQAYNTRWHSAIATSPAKAWATAAADDLLGGPDHLPRQADADIRVARVNARGTISYNRAQIQLDKHLAGQHVTVLVDHDLLNVHDHTGRHLGHLVLDHAKQYQGRLRQAA